jgi:2-polyprenyl-6-methoxyphenol hydroxylase-like FAD-dependent oxidoreductase
MGLPQGNMADLPKAGGFRDMSDVIETTCCVVGGGPAGMMLGYLLARAGIPVTVLEKHADFLRDFRGDTLHPSTLDVIGELGLLEALLRQPHDEVRHLAGIFGDTEIPVADFSHLPTRCQFIALMPQWDFLNFIATEGRKLPTFDLRMSTEAMDLVTEDGTVTGVRARSPDGEIIIRTALTIGADGRHSIVRGKAGLTVRDFGVPIDVLWLRISRQESDRSYPFGRVTPGHIIVMLDRGDYWQMAVVIEKGTFAIKQQAGIAAFRAELGEALPFLGDRVNEIQSWDQVSLLTVTVDRLDKWAKPGLLCIGDSAHAMSPIGGVGINLAIQDAVAAANILAEPLRQGRPPLAVLERVQERRQWPTVATQSAQVFLHKHGVEPILRTSGPLHVPFVLRLLRWVPWLRRIPARLVGVGVRPEHVRTPLRG